MGNAENDNYADKKSGKHLTIKPSKDMQYMQWMKSLNRNRGIGCPAPWNIQRIRSTCDRIILGHPMGGHLYDLEFNVVLFLNLVLWAIYVDISHYVQNDDLNHTLINPRDSLETISQL